MRFVKFKTGVLVYQNIHHLTSDLRHKSLFFALFSLFYSNYIQHFLRGLDCRNRLVGIESP